MYLYWVGTIRELYSTFKKLWSQHDLQKCKYSSLQQLGQLIINVKHSIVVQTSNSQINGWTSVTVTYQAH